MRLLLPLDAYLIIAAIKAGHLNRVGLAKQGGRTTGSGPWDMILLNLPIMPPCDRPTVLTDKGVGFARHDMSELYIQLLKGDPALGEAVRQGVDRAAIEDGYTKQHRLLYALFKNRGKDVAYRGGRMRGHPYKSIEDTLVGKSGLFRSNIQGLRQEYCYRSVFGPDPLLSVNEMGVPLSAKPALVKHVHVNNLNVGAYQQTIDYVRKWLAAENYEPGNGALSDKKWLERCYAEYQGKQIYYVKTKPRLIGGRETTPRWQSLVDYIRRAPEATQPLAIGTQLEVPKENGDYVMMNRQPTLHRGSMYCFHIRWLPGNCIRLAPAICHQFNGDFDGDEVNLWDEVGWEARAEAAVLMCHEQALVNPTNQKTFVGCWQDSLFGIHALSKPGLLFDREQTMDLLMAARPDDAMALFSSLRWSVYRHPNSYWYTGSSIVSALFPSVLSHGEGGDTLASFDKQAYIRNGQLLAGTLTKGQLGPSSNSLAKRLIDTITTNDGCRAAVALLDGLNWLGNYYMGVRGLTSGLRDITPEWVDKEDEATVFAEMDKRLAEEERQLCSPGGIKANVGQTVTQTHEEHLRAIFNKSADDLAKVRTRHLPPDSGFVAMINCGSKGGWPNLCQVPGLVGQQHLNGQLVPLGFKGRSLPHFPRDDRIRATYATSERYAISRGYCPNSYLRGLTPPEFFFHTMSGREGIVATAVKTSETGYVQHEAVAATVDLSPRYDQTVRDAGNNVVSFRYGDDGVATDRVTNNKLPFDSLRRGLPPRPSLPVNAPEEERQALFTEYVGLGAYRHWLLTTRGGDLVTSRYSPPFDFNALALSVTRTPTLPPISHVRLTTWRNHVIDAACGSVGRTPNADHEDGATLLEIYLAYCFSSSVIIGEWGFDELAVALLATMVREKVARSPITPGEAVGVIAAQAIGEPATQMTLNTFHYAGVPGRNITAGGIPRLKQLLQCTGDPARALHTIYLPKGNETKEAAARFLHSAAAISLNDLFPEQHVLYDPPGAGPGLRCSVDADFVRQCEQDRLPGEPEPTSCWVYRFHSAQPRLAWWRELEGIAEAYPPGTIEEVIIDRTTYSTVRIRVNGNHLPPGLVPTSADSTPTTAWLQALGLMPLRRGIDISKTVIESYPTASSPTFRLLTTGLDVEGIRGLVRKGADPTRHECSDLTTVYNLYGIEAARQHFINELRALFSSNDIANDYRHLALLADYMSQTGRLLPFNYHGIRHGAGTSVLALASFERGAATLASAALRGSQDPLTATSARICLGKEVGGASSDFTLLNDVEKAMRGRVPPRSSARPLPPTHSTTRKRAHVDTPSRRPTMGTYQAVDIGALLAHHQERLGVAPPPPPPPRTRYCPTSPSYSPTSPSYFPRSPRSPSRFGYDPVQPRVHTVGTGPAYDPCSPAYEPCSPAYDPLASPLLTKVRHCPTSPTYCPTSPTPRFRCQQ
jgi:DNA-directed RNA polymerase II subunit RPB1